MRGGESPWYLEKSVVQRALERKDRGGPSVSSDRNTCCGGANESLIWFSLMRRCKAMLLHSKPPLIAFCKWLDEVTPQLCS